jgi:hypothetical protein
MNCPKCKRPAPVKPPGVVHGFAFARCPHCDLMGVVGSDEPWIPCGDPDAWQRLDDMGWRLEKAEAMRQVRYQDLETK